MTKTGELALFLEIWEERSHFCQNNECTEPIEHFNQAQFHHVKTKGSDPKNRLDKDVIYILCADCHDLAHQKGNDALNLTDQTETNLWKVKALLGII